ncbi:MAG TPA: GNAT family N-acetyltransferase [Mycobacteriales bacterium]|nr:GNAT family N-acetyltransferase [Mycobacteriales bacterium]
MVAGGELYDASAQPAFIAVVDGDPAGLLTYRLTDEALLVVSLDAVVKRRGIGATLLNHAFDDARGRGLQRVWLTTSNELADALAFYLSQGMRLTEVNLDAMADARQLKPLIPTHAADGTPIRDEWVLERALRNNRDA